MAHETLNETPEVSKKKSTVENVLDYIPSWIPGVGAVRESKKRIEGRSTAKKKKDNPFGEYE